MSSFSRVLFLDEENTGLSIMAEAMMDADPRRGETQILSRGMVVLFPEPVNAKAAQTLQEHGLQAKKQVSGQLETEDITETTLVLTMTEAEKLRILEKVPQANFVYTVREFAGEQGDLAEPFGSRENYETCFARLMELLEAIGRILFA